MRKNNTRLGRYSTGRAKRPAFKKNKRSFSSNISANYMMMLQIYYLNKKENGTKKELKYKRAARRSISTAGRSSFSISAAISGFFNANLLLLKKAKTGMALAAE